MNKKTLLLGMIPTFLTIFSCNNSGNKDSETSSDSTEIIANDSGNNQEVIADASSFNPETLPETTADIGQFPFFTVPDWINPKSSYGFDRESDFGLIEFYTGESFYPLEGHVFVKGYSMSDPKDAGRGTWDEYKFVQSFSKHFESLGAKKLFEGNIPSEKSKELDETKNKKGYFFDFATSHQDNLVTYGLKKDGKVILFAITSNSAFGALYVGESEAFKQTITIIKADQIEKDLNEKGKSVLNINFDTDKATLKPDGKDVVEEIAKVLQSNSSLKLDINGYTDNVGDANHNLQLSKDRANTVLNTLIEGGIDKSRLSANGFGATNFIADNNTDAGKEQNRRVELIKK